MILLVSKIEWIEWKTVWSPCIAFFSCDEVDHGTVFNLMAKEGIRFRTIGGRGVRLFVAFEDVDRAFEVLRRTPATRNGDLFTVLGGPRPGTIEQVAMVDASWIERGRFKPNVVAPTELQTLLNKRGIECGMVGYPWKEEYSIFVPSTHREAALSALRECSLDISIVLSDAEHHQKVVGKRKHGSSSGPDR